MNLRLLVLAALATIATGCGCFAEPETPDENALALLGPGDARRRVPGASASKPIESCGARQSYDYVARRFRCEDGENPFDGNWRAAASHRLGSTAARRRDGHRVDVYEVPCEDGPVHVFVDMYSCRSGRP
jgi:hypothetical protein